MNGKDEKYERQQKDVHKKRIREERPFAVNGAFLSLYLSDQINYKL